MQEASFVPLQRETGPLPEESLFVAAARDAMPAGRGRVTTAQTRGSLRGRGRGRVTGAERDSSPSERVSATAQRGRGSATTQRGRGSVSRSRGKRAAKGKGKASRKSDASEAGTSAPKRRKRGYKTGPGSVHYMLFGDDTEGRFAVPDLNETVPEETQEELVLTQNAPI